MFIYFERIVLGIDFSEYSLLGVGGGGQLTFTFSISVVGHITLLSTNFLCHVPYREELPESSYKYQLLGLNLLRLLAQNRLAEFHTVSSYSKLF